MVGPGPEFQCSRCVDGDEIWGEKGYIYCEMEVECVG